MIANAAKPTMDPIRRPQAEGTFAVETIGKPCSGIGRFGRALYFTVVIGNSTAPSFPR
ncbi:MAG: hypothetical protein HUU22_06855 [Phycisphaerae bacterium]|nr:hypothetical protein [Phycisphaerae bacterium]NUQ45734.1 hypothetical protein [Phycisphaerae bacterium]